MGMKFSTQKQKFPLTNLVIDNKINLIWYVTEGDDSKSQTEIEIQISGTSFSPFNKRSKIDENKYPYLQASPDELDFTDYKTGSKGILSTRLINRSQKDDLVVSFENQLQDLEITNACVDFDSFSILNQSELTTILPLKVKSGYSLSSTLYPLENIVLIIGLNIHFPMQIQTWILSHIKAFD
jgi:hypothetical protein